MKKIIITLLIAFPFFVAQSFGQNWTLTGNDIYNNNSGYVGIGTTTPSRLLQVSKNMVAPSIEIHNTGGTGGAAFRMIDDASGAQWTFKATSTGGFKIRDIASGTNVIQVEQGASPNTLYLNSSGAVGIGTNTIPAGYKFAVDGNVIVESLEVQLSGSWPDYVFKPDYKLMSLPDLEAFIQKNGHLPNITSAEEMKNSNVDLLKMNVKLLEKVEELSLYVIELQKEVDKLKNKN